MLLLKLFLVPLFLLLVSLAGKRFGPAVAGWLAGLPVVAGPILFFIAMERGEVFAATAAALSLSAVLASVAFSLAYARACLRWGWGVALVAGLSGWCVAAGVLSQLPMSPGLALGVSLLTLLMAPRLFPAVPVQAAGRGTTTLELACRMLAGAALTVGVTVAAARLGPAWSGLLAVFPVLGIVLAVFSHRSHGPAFAAALLRAMATGLYSFVAFCFVLSLALPAWGVATAFTLATVASLAVQAGTRRRFAGPLPRAT
ncbi:MAG: hypothetical protein ABW190_06045 [Rhizobacter sp.]